MLIGPDLTPAEHQTPHGLVEGTTRPVHKVDDNGWVVSLVSGNPGSMWAEHRAPQVIVYAMSVCGRALHTQQADGPGDGQTMCRACTEPAYLAAQLTRIDHPRFEG
jgi:hypothetical protein